MKLKAISSSILLALLPISGVYAAAMDRSGQSINAFLQPNNYFEAGISILDPDVSGKAVSNGSSINDMADDYYFPNAALKLQVTDNFSFGLLYDQPFGAKATFDNVPTNLLAGTEVDVKSQNLSMILGFQPNENFNIYGGAVYQTIKGDLTLSGQALASSISGYKIHLKEDGSAGWLAGVAYQKPDIALKASLTYRSEIDHDLDSVETAPSNGAFNAFWVNPASKDTQITTPQSVNLDFQTGIMTDTVAFANVRWVNWKKISISPDKFDQVSKVITGRLGRGTNGFELLQYSEDQWSANLGVGRKLTEKWSGTISVGWDSGAGNAVTVLGPTEGYWNIGLGAQFSPTPNTFLQAGVKYFWLGDAKGQLASQAGTNEYLADFKDNNAIAYGLKIGYKF